MFLSRRGFIFGIWSANASVGNILGALMAASVLGYGYHVRNNAHPFYRESVFQVSFSFKYTFLISSAVLFAGGIVMFFGLVPSPKDIGLSDPDAEDKDEANDSQEQLEVPLISHENSKPKAIGFFQAVCLPGVVMVTSNWKRATLLTDHFDLDAAFDSSSTRSATPA